MAIAIRGQLLHVPQDNIPAAIMALTNQVAVVRDKETDVGERSAPAITERAVQRQGVV